MQYTEGRKKETAMEQGKFSAVEQELLRKSVHWKVTENQISFTLAFKEAFWRLV